MQIKSNGEFAVCICSQQAMLCPEGTKFAFSNPTQCLANGEWPKFISSIEKESVAAAFLKRLPTP